MYSSSTHNGWNCNKFGRHNTCSLRAFLAVRILAVLRNASTEGCWLLMSVGDESPAVHIEPASSEVSACVSCAHGAKSTAVLAVAISTGK